MLSKIQIEITCRCQNVIQQILTVFYLLATHFSFFDTFHQLHITSPHCNMSECVVISGSLDAKLRNKLFSYFSQRYVELVYIESETENDGIYELRFYKNKHKTSSSLFSFVINPISMTCYINYLNSNKHKFTYNSIYIYTSPLLYIT